MAAAFFDGDQTFSLEKTKMLTGPGGGQPQGLAELLDGCLSIPPEVIEDSLTSELHQVAASAARQSPLLPPLFVTSRTPSSCMPRSTALHMS